MRRRLASSITLLAYLAAAIGFPMPGWATARSASCCCGTVQQCQASACGCSHGTPGPIENAKPSCCSQRGQPEPKSCCEKKSDTKKTPGKSKAIGWAIGMSAQKCQGGTTDWVHAEIALPGPTPMDWQPSWPFCHALSITHQHPFVLSGDRLDPPPRLAAI
ncbi:MAG: hypothetical protein HYX68_16300 [Planctomycetes bacterium]|nr:hypothetical protein [Planctomycetota bacterium]